MRNRQKKREKKNSNPISGPTTAQEKQEQAQTTHHLRTALKQGKARRKRKEEAQPERSMKSDILDPSYAENLRRKQAEYGVPPGKREAAEKASSR